MNDSHPFPSSLSSICSVVVVLSAFRLPVLPRHAQIDMHSGIRGHSWLILFNGYSTIILDIWGSWGINDIELASALDD